MAEEYTVYSDFNMEKHKETFINYLEVIIHPDGTIHYAVPSHQEYLIRLACMQKGITRERLDKLCPEKYYCDFMYWLCLITECVAVWNNGIIGKITTKQQRDAVISLVENSLMELSMDYKYDKDMNNYAL